MDSLLSPSGQSSAQRSTGYLYSGKLTPPDLPPITPKPIKASRGQGPPSLPAAAATAPAA